MVLKRNKDGWEIQGDPQLVRLERGVHQFHRLLRAQGLRLEADQWLGQTLLKGQIPAGWILGRYHYLTHHQPLRLIRERILDAWLTVLDHECRLSDTSDLVIIELASLPLRLLADQRHPLVFGQNLQLSDLLRYPRTNLATGITPWLENEIRHRGLWDTPITANYYSSEDWEGRAANQAAILYGHDLTLEINPWLKPLDYALNLPLQISLILHQDLASHAIVHQLAGWIKQQLQARQKLYPDLKLAT